MMGGFRFPDEGALEAALRTGLIPAALGPVRVAREGRAILVGPATDAALEKVPMPADAVSRAAWALALPCRRAGGAPGEALFVEPPEGALALAGELLRLGCDRIALGPGAVRALAPPAWVLARAEPGDPAPLRAYAPAGSGVWIAVGHAHPLADLLAAPAGHLLVVDADGEARLLPDGPWHDATARAEVTGATLVPLAAEPPAALRIALRLVPTRVHPVARLWTLPASAWDAVDALAAALDEAALDGLDFAVARRGDERLAVLRARADIDPELPQATAYAPVREVPGVHTPVGQALAPRVWPERLRAALCPDGDEVVWLRAADGGLVAERLRDADFAPLGDWALVRIDEAAPALAAWVAQVSFDAPEAVPEVAAAAATVPEPVVARRQARPPPRPARGRAAGGELAALERRLRALDAGDPERPGLWRAIAAIHPSAAEAALAWGHAVWGRPGSETAEARALLDERPADPADDPRRRALVIIAGAADDTGWLVAHDEALDVRVAWLAHLALARRGGGAIALSRARDRWIERLGPGLALGRDVPALLRRAGGAPTQEQRARGAALDEALALLAAAPAVDNPLEAPAQLTWAHVRLVFAHAFARLGLGDRAEALAAAAEAELPAGDPVHRAALALHRARRGAVAEGAGDAEVTLPAGLLPASPLDRYKLDRLRAASGFLGGAGWIDPVAGFRHGASAPSGPGRDACLAAWAGRLGEAARLAGELAQSVRAAPPPTPRAAAALGHVLAGVARGLVRQGMPLPAALTDLLALPLAPLTRTALLAPLAGIAGAPAAGWELVDDGPLDERLLAAEALAAHASAAAPAEGRAAALRLAPLAAEVTDSLSTNSHFCLARLRLAEALALAIVGDAAPGARERAWLDEDERLVRRRIHADFAALVRGETP